MKIYYERNEAEKGGRREGEREEGNPVKDKDSCLIINFLRVPSTLE